MSRPQNNLSEHLQSIHASRSGGASSSNRFRPVNLSLHRQPSFGSAQSAVLAPAVTREHAVSPSIVTTISPQIAHISTPAIPAKRPSDTSSSASPRQQKRADTRDDPSSGTVPRPPSSIASSSHSALHAPSGAIPPQRVQTSGDEQRSSQPKSVASVSNANGEVSTVELEAQLEDMRSKKEKILEQMVEMFESGHPALERQLLAVQRSFLDQQITTIKDRIASLRASGGQASGPLRTDNALTPDGSVHVPQGRSSPIGIRSPFTATDRPNIISTLPPYAPKPSNAPVYAHRDQENLSSNRGPTQDFPPAPVISPRQNRDEPILIDDSPPPSPAPSRRGPVFGQTPQDAGFEARSTSLSSRAAGKQRANDDFEEDYSVDDSVSPNAMRQYQGQSSSNNGKQVGDNRRDHPWSKGLFSNLRETFKLREFRQNQLEAINATLAGKDVFCLMPTGGGKSLCYQLPALLNSGKTRGVTIVISPLLSLITDQVQSLLAKDIPAVAMTGDQTQEHRNWVMSVLCQPEPSIKLVYITPEFVTKSGRAREIFALLHRRQRLARFVIDEAHCVSQWGHDFRPDYKELGLLRRECPGVPIMAMTATANARVKTDVVANLGIQNCVLLHSSFNRSNLTYAVRPKTKDVLANMSRFITANYKGECGIIYCLSRKSCEDIARKLSKDFGVDAHHYHAGMGKKERLSVQAKWQAGDFKVIVATIAFGMGIDKADVRFVMHHTLPSSLEGYYQETGRAGRDGKHSQCILYYAYRDSTSILRMIQDGEGTKEQKDQRRNNLHQVISYCMNLTDCRRAQVLQYFGEVFDRANCHAGCDICEAQEKAQTKLIDVTEAAQSVVRLVKELGAKKKGTGVTMLYCVDVFRGVSKKMIRDRGHEQCPEFGKGSSLTRGEAERLFQMLIVRRILGERSEVNGMGFANTYMQLGPEAKTFMREKRQLQLETVVTASRSASTLGTRRRGATAKKTTSTLAFEEDPYDVANIDFDEDDGENIDVSAELREDAAQARIEREGSSQMRESSMSPVKLSAPPRKRTQASAPKVNAACLAELRRARADIAVANGCPQDVVATEDVLVAVATQLPTTTQELAKIEGLNDTTLNFFGSQLTSVCSKHLSNADQAGSTATASGSRNAFSQFRYDGGASSSSRSSAATRPAKQSGAAKETSGSSSASKSSSIRPLVGAKSTGNRSTAVPKKRASAF